MLKRKTCCWYLSFLDEHLSLLDSHPACYQCNGHGACRVLVAGFLMKFSLKKKQPNPHNFIFKSHDVKGSFHPVMVSFTLPVYGKPTDPWGQCVGIAGSNLSCQTHSEELIIRNADSYIFVKCQFDRSTDSWRASNRPVIAWLWKVAEDRQMHWKNKMSKIPKWC